MDSLNFKVLVSGKGGSKGEEKISVTKGGIISFLGAFYKSQALHTYRYVQISFDKANGAIGFVFSYDAMKNSYKLLHKKSGATVQSLVLWDEMGHKPEEIVGRYTPHIYEMGGNKIHYILLNEKDQHESSV
jgi:hypothetical protein